MAEADDEGTRVCKGHRPAQLVLMLGTLLVFILLVLFHGLASMPGLFPGVFHNTTEEILDLYYIEIMPADWTFLMWVVVYGYQVVFFLYILSTMCRRCHEGYLYYSPPYMPVVIYILYIFNNGCNLTWLFLYDRRLLQYALIFITVVAITLYICLAMSINRLHLYAPTLIKEGKKWEPSAVIGIVHNGLGMYAAWATVMALLNGAIVLVYHLNMQQSIASTVALCVLAFVSTVYAILDLVVFEKFLRHVYTPHIVLQVALAGILHQNWDLERHNTILALGLAVIAACLFIFKTIHSFLESRKRFLSPQVDDNNADSNSS